MSLRALLLPFIVCMVGVACRDGANRSATEQAPSSPTPARDELSLAGGRFSVLLSYRSDAEAAAVIDGLEIEPLLDGSLSEIAAVLAGPPASIEIVADASRAIPEIGIGGFADPSSGWVTIYLDADFGPGLDTTLPTWLPATLAHELHHSVRITDGPGYGRTLLESMVTEGLADAFQREVFPDAQAPWNDALSAAEERELWETAQPLLDQPDSQQLHFQWFFGRGSVPRWAGYTIGYHIVRSYLQAHPDATAAALVTKPAADILKGSRYYP